MGAGARWGSEHCGGRSTVGAGALWGERGLSIAPSAHKIRKFSRQLRPRGERGWSFAPSAHKFREFWRMLRPWGERGWSFAPSAHKIREFWRMLRPRGERGCSIAPSAHKIREFWRMLRSRGERHISFAPSLVISYAFPYPAAILSYPARPHSRSASHSFRSPGDRELLKRSDCERSRRPLPALTC